MEISKRRWIGRAVMFAAVGAVYVLLGACSKPASAGYTQYAHGGMAMLKVVPNPPAQTTRAFQDQAGAEHHLSDFHGKVTLVNYWATWCTPCVEEMPTLGGLARHFAGRVNVIPISIDTDTSKAKAQDELRRLGGGALPFYIEPTSSIIFDIQAQGAPQGMPTSILYDSNGRELLRVTGRGDWVSPEAVAMIDQALKQ
jgi:thiol-disulfide isomerase/thioredoxin